MPELWNTLVQPSTVLLKFNGLSECTYPDVMDKLFKPPKLRLSRLARWPLAPSDLSKTTVPAPEGDEGAQQTSFSSPYGQMY